MPLQLQVLTEAELPLFWERRRQYLHDDVFPNCTFEPITEEETAWYLSREYKEHLLALFAREVDPLRFVFFLSDTAYAGFANYATYHSEDGKCFVLDFCIDPPRRNSGLGAQCYALLEQTVKADGATYMALNLSNENNLRFWTRQGFQASGTDEYNSVVYTKVL